MCWLLLMTLWMPLLNYAQSYTSLVQRALPILGDPVCVHAQGLSQGQIAAFQFYGQLILKSTGSSDQCLWLIAESDPDNAIPAGVSSRHWAHQSLVEHPTDAALNVHVFKRR